MTKCYACKKKVIVNEVGGQAQFFHNISGTIDNDQCNILEQDIKAAALVDSLGPVRGDWVRC